MDFANAFFFPNELNLNWTVYIILFPYLVSIASGSFMISSFITIFKIKSLQPLNRFALIFSLIVLLFSIIPLIFHIQKTDRIFNLMVAPNSYSVISGYIWAYITLTIDIFLIIWFTYRKKFIREYHKSKGSVKFFYNLMLLKDLTDNAKTRKLDHNLKITLHVIGIPLTLILIGFVCMIFSSIKTNLLWSNSYMTIIFMISGLTSGLSILIVVYFLSQWKNKEKIENKTLKKLSRWALSLLSTILLFEFLLFISINYEEVETWNLFKNLIEDHLYFSYIYLQLLIFSIIPLLFLAVSSLFSIKKKVNYFLILTSAIMILLQVLILNWNVIIGGDLISKSLKGILPFFPGIAGSGIINVLLLIIPFLLMWLINKVFPFFTKPD